MCSPSRPRAQPSNEPRPRYLLSREQFDEMSANRQLYLRRNGHAFTAPDAGGFGRGSAGMNRPGLGLPPDQFAAPGRQNPIGGL